MNVRRVPVLPVKTLGGSLVTPGNTWYGSARARAPRGRRRFVAERKSRRVYPTVPLGKEPRRGPAALAATTPKGRHTVEAVSATFAEVQA